MTESGDDVASASALVGTTISGRYRVDAVLGEGGMGAVVRAEDLRLKRSVAIKVMLAELGNSPEFAKRFQREAELAARLQHPNIVSLHDFGTTEDGVSFLVMQLLQGRELGALLGRPLDPRRAVSITAQILRALEHAHAQGVIHRDLKPQNIFLTEDPGSTETVRILDFGLAKPADDLAQQSKGLTRTGMVLGTPTYMSPEQAVGTRVDERTDLYSTGVLLYEMLAGTPPLVDDNAVRLLQRQVTEDPPDLPDVIPAQLRAIVGKLLAKVRSERFESATAALAALEDPSIWSPPEESPAELPTLHAPAPVSSTADDGDPPVSSVPAAPPVDPAQPPPRPEARKPRRPRRKARRRRKSRVGVRTPLVLAAILTALFVGWLVAPGRSAAERLDDLTTRIAEVAGRIVSGNSARQ